MYSLLLSIWLFLLPYQDYFRVTYYTLTGTMANGNTTHMGAAACSGWLPLGTKIVFENAFIVTCEDRGMGDNYWNRWVDVWAPSDKWGQENIINEYGDYAWVIVVK